MNASLQCLSHTHLLRDIFLKPKSTKREYPTGDLSSYSSMQLINALIYINVDIFTDVTFIPLATQTDKKNGKTQELVEAFETLQRSMWNDQGSILDSLKNIKVL